MHTIYDFAFAVILIFSLILYIIIDFKRNGKSNLVRRILFYSFIFYLLIVARLTIGGIWIPLSKDNEPSVQLVPFYFLKDLFLMYRYVGIDWFFWNSLKLTFFNFIMLMPLGVYLSFLFKIESKIKAFLIVFLVSFMIETVQLSFTYIGLIRPRTFNVDDIIMNSMGGYIAFLLCVLLKKVYFDKRLGNKI
ncbi:VanZ family protein [Sporosarcina siberiensis]|uniref:VanZ family protein n=1 Tax=Sporosarcina siberiensis TaxID=1365606 RepID=A0ABW4SIU1_9BACL